ncbi:winged helix-turn-helix domain-containing protein [Halobaculum rubrum]|uniref:winged helix-turn-helix domain-containing protein n=1 Tax=Halobaculum rubrum TaxID=2872158 RepID=UPI001CA40F69|nr:winged helix-turn-helix domain-containing protein [Halobaculum rubrum]QZY01195.1 winged helix-turn-helix domain-containing protein [Halobaculum rubrum]
MNNSPDVDPEDIAWTDLTSIERTTLNLIARRERDRSEQPKHSFTRGSSHFMAETDPNPDPDDEALSDLTNKGLVRHIDEKYVLTDAGQQLLYVESTDIESIPHSSIHDIGDSAPSCPNCGDPVRSLSVTGPGTVRAGPCDCQLPGPLAADPLTDRLEEALHLTDDADARYHIRQAMQLAFARAHRSTQ